MHDHVEEWDLTFTVVSAVIRKASINSDRLQRSFSMQMCGSKSSLHCQLAVLLSVRLDEVEAEVVGKLWHEKHLSWMLCVTFS